MTRQNNGPDEVLGPQVDGLQWLETSREIEQAAVPEPEPEDVEEEIIEHPIALLCGQGVLVDSVAALAEACGFIVEFAALHPEMEGEEDGEIDPDLENIHDYENFVEENQISNNYFVCIFLENPQTCETILKQCLESHAAYLGLYADMENGAAILSSLRSDGVPNAELAAVHCPIGLNIGATTPDQLAVAVVAEMLATRNGTMTKLLTQAQR